MTMLKSALKSAARTVAPRVYFRYKFRSLRAAGHEAELKLVPLLAEESKTSLDIGASGGLYVAHMVDCSKDCVAFEPQPSSADELEAMVKTLNLPVPVERVALSDIPGRATMRVLVSDLGRSTIERENQLDDPDGSERTEYEVPVKALDEFSFDSVGFVKIDVEGHEIAVIQGGLNMIKEHRPNLLIEVEDRHKPGATRQVLDLLHQMGYAGFFIYDDRLTSVEDFVGEIHQDSRNISGWKDGWKRTGVYVNNFVFVPEEKVASFLGPANVVLS